MKKPIQKNELRRIICLAFVCGVAACATPSVLAKKDNPMGKTSPHNVTMTLWQTIAELTRQIPFSKEKVEQVLSARLIKSDEQGNEYFWFYESEQVALQGGASVRADLRLRRDGSRPGFLVLNISGPCARLAEVRAHYGQLKITDHPRGRSLEEVTSHTAELPWGELSFSFKERQPDCLSSVAFNPAQKP